jgi:hypothetical protein
MWQHLRGERSDFLMSPLGIPWESTTYLFLVLCQGIGSLVYVTHWPQRVAPPSLKHFVSHWCHSHILMHIALFVCYNAG